MEGSFRYVRLVRSGTPSRMTGLAGTSRSGLHDITCITKQQLLSGFVCRQTPSKTLLNLKYAYMTRVGKQNLDMLNQPEEVHEGCFTCPVPSPASESSATLQLPSCLASSVPSTQLLTPALYHTREPFSRPSKVSCFQAAALLAVPCPDFWLPCLLTHPPPGFFPGSFSCRFR